MSHSGANLRRLLEPANRPARVGGVHDGLSALVAERCGFDALWASGLGIAAARGVPDANILTMSEVRDAAEVIARASSRPVIADCDTGFGEIRNLRRMVQEFELAGVAAVCIEDKQFPKRNSFLPGQDLVDPYEFATKLRVAKETQRDPDFMVIARIEALIAGEPMEDALRRGALYEDAGADAVVIHSKSRSPDEVVTFARAWTAGGHKAPLVAIPTTYSAAPIDLLAEAGFAMVIYANHALRASISAMEQTLRQIVAAGSSASVEHEIAPVRAVFDLTSEDSVERHDEWFAAAIERERARSERPAHTVAR